MDISLREAITGISGALSAAPLPSIAICTGWKFTQYDMILLGYQYVWFYIMFILYYVILTAQSSKNLGILPIFCLSICKYASKLFLLLIFQLLDRSFFKKGSLLVISRNTVAKPVFFSVFFSNYLWNFHCYFFYIVGNDFSNISLGWQVHFIQRSKMFISKVDVVPAFHAPFSSVLLFISVPGFSS